LHGLEACNKGFWFLQELGCTVWKPATKGSLVLATAWLHGLEACNKRVLVPATPWLHGLEACNKGFSGSSNTLVARFGFQHGGLGEL
jgi:hypothetical protein